MDPPCDHVSCLTLPASTASRPAFVTIASRPSEGRDGGSCRFDLGREKTEMFLGKGLDRQVTDLPRRHIGQPVTVKRPARPTHSPAVIVRESGRSSTPRLFESIAGACDYWMPAFAGMTKKERSDCCAIFL